MNVQRGFSLLLTTFLAGVMVPLPSQSRYMKPIGAVIRLVSSTVRRVMFRGRTNEVIPAFRRAKALITRTCATACRRKGLPAMLAGFDDWSLADLEIRFTSFGTRYGCTVLGAPFSPRELGRNAGGLALIRTIVPTPMCFRRVNVEHTTARSTCSIFARTFRWCSDLVRVGTYTMARTKPSSTTVDFGNERMKRLSALFALSGGTLGGHRSLSLRCHSGGVTAPPGFPIYMPILPPLDETGGVS